MAYTFGNKRDRQGREYIEITGYSGNAGRLRIPETLAGLPVEGIAASAFRGRMELVELWLPEHLRALGSYAFYNCKNLKSIHLYDRVEDYCDGVVKQCDSLREIHLTLTRDDYTVMREILADNDRQLTFCIEPVGARLTFPAYVYDFVEDVEARVLHHKIEGSGYPCRECVTRQGVNYKEYDRLFSRVCTDDGRAAARIALERLMYPVLLEEKRRRDYEEYLAENVGELLKVIAGEERLEELRYLCGSFLLPKADLQEAVALAAGKRKSEAVAVLMEYQRRHFLAEDTGALSLGEW
ncbi:MAG: leucine-rich repeat domain-containing protein [Muribaculaceae bacterium]|nr:leucine-rich repeat domain-containing protein [Roseburia sp.]MCM1431319.1 leucine-rich repeat domain-containing protein [Muribaculaceae bacterium]MCM1492195.1 leucine-rich repeat domain-containing protein [Muribaculaceae bacterium]